MNYDFSHWATLVSFEYFEIFWNFRNQAYFEREKNQHSLFKDLVKMVAQEGK